jgi:L-threonylcarbamoyladenylate synthase
VLSIDGQAPAPEVIAEAVRVLRAGGLVAFPTETVYGLGARALDVPAVERVFAAKGRPGRHPLIAHALGEKDARLLASAWPAAASAFARAFWPGPLTLVVPRAAHVPDALTGGGDSVAIRAPAHLVARALLRALGEPIAAPSANRYQSISPTRAEHVVKSLGGAVDLIVDGGSCAAGIESTVLDVRAETPRVLRPGAVPFDALAAIDPRVVRGGGVVPEAAVRASPGLDARHYAPKVPLSVVAGRAEAIAAAHVSAIGGRTGLVLRGAPVPIDQSVVAIALPADAVGYAQGLFAALHALEDAGVSRIVVEAVPDTDSWAAVADRLERASR